MPGLHSGPAGPSDVQAPTGAGPDGRGPGRLRVALVGTCAWPVPGGMEAYLHALAEALAERGHGVSVVTRFARARPETMAGLHAGWEPARRHRDGRGVAVETVSPTRPGRLLLRAVHRAHFRAPGLAARLMATALGRSLRRAVRGADVVHYSGTGRELLGFVAAAEAARRAVPFVVTPHTHQGQWGEGAVDRALYRAADRVVALTNDERQRLAAMGVAPSAIAVVGHGVCVRGDGDGRRFRDRHGLGDAPVVLFLGRQSAAKGLDVLLDAVPGLRARVPGARVVVAGPPGDRPAAPTSEAGVCRLGLLSDGEREDALAAASVLCLPSEGEAFGLVVLEAWAYGVPVVVSDLPTLRERVDAAGGGVAVPRTAGAVSHALARLLTEPETRGAMGAAGRRHAAGCTWARAAAQVDALYRDAVRQRAAPGGGVSAPGGRGDE